MPLTTYQLLIIVINLNKPEDISFDGVQESPTGDSLQFTDRKKNEPSYGASFYVPVENATPHALPQAIQRKRAEFAPKPPTNWQEDPNARPRRPLQQRAPMQLTGPSISHK